MPPNSTLPDSQALLDAVLGGFHALLLENGDGITHDPVRGKQRAEIPAACLFALCATGRHDAPEAEQCRRLLLCLRNREGLWDEMAYGPDDEAVGFYGLVPTAYAVLALARRAAAANDRTDIPALVAACDAIYGTENDGTLVKAAHNRSAVLNTNLLGAQALMAVAHMLPQASNRRRMYTGLAERVIRRALGYQSPRGFFPYHFESLAVPILYQAMVTAQLRQLLHYFPQPVLRLAVRQGGRALRSVFNASGDILWDRANNHDKRGAMWAHTFALAALDGDDGLLPAICAKLSGSMRDGLFVGVEGATLPDPFYSAWMSFGLVWSLEKPALDLTVSPGLMLRRAWLLVEYWCTALSFVGAYALHRLRAWVFPCGTLENRRWK